MLTLPVYRKLISIDAFRGLAALSIVVLHTSRIIKQDPANTWPVGDYLELGYLGVCFFFVLSGFIIPYAYLSRIGKPVALYSYCYNRFTRIYPFYWVLLTIVIFTNWQSGHNMPSLLNFFDNTVLAPTSQDNLFIGVAWTLKHEILFYAVFASLIINQTIGRILFLVWGLGIIFVGFRGTSPPYFDVLFHPMNALFYIGFIAALIIRRIDDSFLVFCLPSGICIFIIAAATILNIGISHLSSDIAQIVFGLAFALIIVGTVKFELNKPIVLLKHFSLLGAASYSVYLTHSFFIPVLYKFTTTVFGQGGPQLLLSFLVIVVISVLIGILVYWVIERPLLTWSRSIKVDFKAI